MYTSLLIRLVADNSGLKTAQDAKVVKGIIDTIMKTTKKGEDVTIKGFGTFYYVEALRPHRPQS